MSTHRVREHVRVIDGETVKVGAHDRTSQGASSEKKYTYQTTSMKPAKRKRLRQSDIVGAAVTLSGMTGLAAVYFLQLVMSLTLAILVVAVTILTTLTTMLINYNRKKAGTRKASPRTGSGTRKPPASGTRTAPSAKPGTRNAKPGTSGTRTGSGTRKPGTPPPSGTRTTPPKTGTHRDLKVGPVRFVWSKS